MKGTTTPHFVVRRLGLLPARIRPWLLGGLAVAVGVLAAVAVSTFFPGWATTQDGQAASDGIKKLFVPPERLAFGQTWESKEFTWALPITNWDQQDVEIEHFATTCNCTKIEPSSLSIPPGQTREVRLTVDLTPERNTKQAESQQWAFEVGIGPKLRDEEAPKVPDWWIVRGTVQRLLRLSVPVVDMGRQSERSQPLPLRHLLVSSAVPLKGLTATTPLSFVPVISALEPERHDQFQLTINSPPGLPIGPVKEEIRLTARLETGEEVTKIVPVTGRIVADCQPDPPAAVLGARLVGETAQESVMLYSLTKQPFEVIDYTVAGKGLSLLALPEGPGEGPAFRVQQEIVEAGEQTGKVFFKLRTARGEPVEVVVTVSYRGLNP
jgi:Protein of unknown function (DUF1573)